MCGITGFVHFDRERPASASVLRRMMHTLAHRGPDDEGLHVDRNVALGHRRLAIIDLETGQQPLLSDDRTVAVVFNGEIYNYVELRDELIAAGHCFHTRSDTEVLVHGYRAWGLELQSKLNGMWAFAIWDSKAQRLVLSRDRIGEKPLYFAEIDGTLVFGSELKAISAYGVALSPDLSLLELYLTLGYVPCPFSFLKNVRKLAPGSHLVLTRNHLSLDRYWDLPAVPENKMNRDSGAVHKHFESLLRDSVRLRMRSDVDFGAFLSGGLDSTTVVALMSGLTSRPVQTFTIGFDHSSLDERPLARAVAARFQTSHHEDVVRYSLLEESIATILKYTDEPFGDASSVPTERVARYARRHVKMVLSGDGGDEVLSGYNSYQSEQLAAYLAWVPSTALEGLANIVRRSGSLLGFRLQEITAHAAKIIRLSAVPFQTRLLAKAYGDLATVRALLADVDTQQIRVDDFFEDFFKSCPWRDPFYQLMYYNLKSTLPDDILTKVDRMSMANSLEVRTPFLDHRLIEYMAGVHKKVRLPYFVRKAVLRRTVARGLPRCITRARKRGFVAPIRYWLSADQAPQIVERLLRGSTLPLRRDVIARVLAANARREADNSQLIWMLLVAARWVK